MIRAWIYGGLALTVMALEGTGPGPGSRTTTTGFLDRSVRSSGTDYPYVVYVPRDYSTSKRWPVILFLHGGAERGDDGLKQSEVGLGSAIRRRSRLYPALVVMPQCPGKERWAHGAAAAAIRAVDEVMREFRCDPARVYLTGISVGGAGCWRVAMDNPGKFAAIIAISGGGPVEEIARKLRDMPVWVFTGDQDHPTTVDYGRRITRALKDAGNRRVKYTEYPGMPHNCWDTAYGEFQVTQWLFAQRKS